MIVADPPWLFDKRVGDMSTRGRPPYPVMAVCSVDAATRAAS